MELTDVLYLFARAVKDELPGNEDISDGVAIDMGMRMLVAAVRCVIDSHPNSAHEWRKVLGRTTE